MSKIKLKHIDNLSHGKKSGAKIGSRAIPHHLHSYEREKYKRAMKYKYLEITTKDRINLINIWAKVCELRGWKNYLLLKDTSQGHAKILEGDTVISSGPTKEMKRIIQSLV